MSQAKVDKYKNEKANRKSTIKKQKILGRVAKTVLAIVIIAIIACIGYEGYKAYQNSQPAETYYVDLDGVQDYLNTLTE